MFILIATIDSIKTVPKDVADIKNDLKTLNDKFDALDPRLTTSEARITAQETEISNLKSNGGTMNSSDTEEILREINERSKCISNIIVYGLPESNLKDANTRKKYDSTKISTLFSAIRADSKTENLKMFRLGVLSRDKTNPCPLKVICRIETEGSSFIESFDPSMIEDLADEFGNVSLERDRTKRERQHLMGLRNELQARSSSVKPI